MKDITYALGQITVVPGRPNVNAERIVAEAKAAARRGVDVIVFPELCVSGYLLGDLFEDDAFVLDVQHWNQWIISSLADLSIVVVFGTIVADRHCVGEDGRLRKYNAAIIAQGGKPIENAAGMDFTAKTLHPNYRIFDDSRHFFCLRKLAAERGVELEVLLRPFQVSIKGAWRKLGVMTCEDMWDGDYAQKPSRILAENGAEVVINLSCSPWSWRKNQKRDEVVRGIVQDIGIPFLYVNNVGSQNNGKNFIAFDGSSTVYDKNGDIICMAEPYKDAVIDVPVFETLVPLRRPEPDDVKQMFSAIRVSTIGYLDSVAEEYRQKIVIGASGGIDSALSLAFFVHLVGKENVIAVNMPYKHYNADETKGDARKLAENLGVEYRVVPIDAMVDANAALCNVQIGSSQHKSIQARMRMEVLATIASQVHGIFTCNANKTEIAFGYGTINGDMRGYFAPWMDCLKQDVFRLAAHMNTFIFGREVIPQSIIEREPMDELVDSGTRGDPFHYGHIGRNGYHDALVRAFVTFRRNPEWVLRKYKIGSLDAELLLEPGTVSGLFPTAKQFVDDLERCYGLFVSMVFKRVQSVPGALVDKRSFGWDLRESILPPYETGQYQSLRREVLKAPKVAEAA
ncbi:MAG: NAD(+) synthase [Candidatus Paceibacterota bacterium]